MAYNQIDEVKYEIEESDYLLHVKGWILEKNYHVIVKAQGKEIYRFIGNKKRYDICLAYDMEITEDNYGFDVNFKVPLDTKMIELYSVINNNEKRFFTIALVASKHHQETLYNLIDSVNRTLSTEWKTNHFRMPVGRMARSFFRFLAGRSDDQLIDAKKAEEYQMWLKNQQYRKFGIFKNITYISADETFKYNRAKTICMKKLDLSKISTDYVCFVGSKCRLYKQFQYYVSECEHHDILYFDNDQLIPNGERRNPQLKPDYSYDTLHAVNYIGHVFVAKKDILKEMDGTDIDLYQYLLKLSYITKDFGHISSILYSDNDIKIENNKQNEYTLEINPLVSIIISTKDHVQDLNSCLQSIYEKTAYKNFEIIIINNNSEKQESFQYFTKIEKEHENLRVAALNCEFNYSYINNYAVKNLAKGEYILLLNNDTKVVTKDWLQRMLCYASYENVGSVGALLMFPDNTIQHAGIIMGKGGIAGHAYSGAPVSTEGFGFELKVPYNVSCSSAACLMVEKKKYLKLNGLNETLKVAFNDVDFGLRLLKAGYRNVFLPNVKLYHYESKSRGVDKSAEQLKRYYSECDYMKNKWHKYIVKDPFYNINFSRDNDYSLYI